MKDRVLTALRPTLQQHPPLEVLGVHRDLDKAADAAFGTRRPIKMKKNTSKDFRAAFRDDLKRQINVTRFIITRLLFDPSCDNLRTQKRKSPKPSGRMLRRFRDL